MFSLTLFSSPSVIQGETGIVVRHWVVISCDFESRQTDAVRMFLAGRQAIGSCVLPNDQLAGQVDAVAGFRQVNQVAARFDR